MKLRFAIAALAAFSVGGLIVTTIAPAHAQAAKRQRRAGGRQEAPIVAAFKNVGPTADAQTKFDALYTKYEADRKNVTATVTDKKEQTAQNNALMAKMRSDADALLTPEQQTRFHTGIVTIPIIKTLGRELTLTPEEETKIQPILDDYATKTEGMKRKEKQPAEIAAKAKIREVLTPDQQTKLDLMPSLTPRAGARNPVNVAPVEPATPPVAPPVAPPAAPPVAPTTP